MNDSILWRRTQCPSQLKLAMLSSLGIQMKSLRWIRQTAGSQGNVISNLAPGTGGGYIWRLSRAALCRKLGCKLSVVNFIISCIRESEAAWRWKIRIWFKKQLARKMRKNRYLLQQNYRSSVSKKSCWKGLNVDVLSRWTADPLLGDRIIDGTTRKQVGEV